VETFFLIIAITGILLEFLLVLLALFEPALEYRIAEPLGCSIESAGFARIMGILTDAQAHIATRIDVLKNGERFYEAELQAINSASRHICLEAYIFQKGEIANRFIAALTARAKAGVKVRIVLDAVGSFNTWRHTFRELIAAGGEVRWYVPFRWYNLPRYNGRTHREILIVDSEVGFIGGAGIADHWHKSRGPKRPRWRDTMFRIQGRAVSSLQAIFAENWLESSGELLASAQYYPECETQGSVAAMIIASTPTQGRATRARMLYQTLITAANRRLWITTPYFLPDRSVRQALINALDRGVEVKIIVPGKHADHLLTRRSSRRLYGDLLRNGAQIFEYQPAMIHTKSLVVDGHWSVVGSTNFDHRSFGLNDEVNLASLDEDLTARLECDFQADLAQSKRITYEEWRKRSPFERLHEWLGWIVERQE
jgi:cardiolipin synthase A/B